MQQLQIKATRFGCSKVTIIRLYSLRKIPCFFHLLYLFFMTCFCCLVHLLVSSTHEEEIVFRSPFYTFLSHYPDFCRPMLRVFYFVVVIVIIIIITACFLLEILIDATLILQVDWRITVVLLLRNVHIFHPFSICFISVSAIYNPRLRSS